ncbi:uncharacterized protein LOC131310399 isoform X2 [Rhododendron vialii]|uniref:uncharacterized protein LOC131310399 isoform X2 n=1 Tax=Rhododendron vialii TaxID=182163 RepID=UPI002660446F|nr:uncharacterized protein LOC131310399 isoform X2 [Rhododendron vialii]
MNREVKKEGSGALTGTSKCLPMTTSSIEEYENPSQIPKPGNRVLMGRSKSLPVATSSTQEENASQIPEPSNRVLMGRSKRLPEATSSTQEYENASQISESEQGSGALLARRKILFEVTSSAKEHEDASQISRPEQGSEALMRRQKSLFELYSSAEKHKDASQISKPEDQGDYWRYIPLYQAALRGDWVAAEAFFNQYKDALTAQINKNSETALHVAAGAGRSSKLIYFVEKLVERISRLSPEALKIPDHFGRTPLHAAAWVGNTEAVKILLEREKSLLDIRAQVWSALDMVARNAKKDTLIYLLEATKDDPLSRLFPDDDSAAHFLVQVIASGYYDIALNLVEKYPSLATSIRPDGDCGLKALAKKVSAFKSGSNHRWWQRIIYDYLVTTEESTSHIRGDIENAVDEPAVTRQRCKHLVEYFYTLGAYNLRAKDALLTAAKLGIHEVLEEIVGSFPDLIWATDERGLNLFQIAVVERHANVFNLIYQMGDNQQLLVQMRDPSGNNLLLGWKTSTSKRKQPGYWCSSADATGSTMV